MSCVTLTDFLLARIAEDEAAWSGGLDLVTRPDFARLAGHMLTECEAKRRIVDYRERVAHESAETGVPLFEAQVSAYDAALRALALPYADHPDYDETWRP